MRVFALAATGVAARAVVLKEIDAANRADRPIRVLLADNGSVRVDHLLFADAVNTDNLKVVIGRVLQVADHVGLLLAAVNGGSTPITPEPFASER